MCNKGTITIPGLFEDIVGKINGIITDKYSITRRGNKGILLFRIKIINKSLLNISELQFITYI